MANFFFTDSSPRTKSIQRPFFAFVAAVLVIIIGFVWYISGNSRYSTILAQSSTPIGSTVAFSQSEAETTLSGIYEDRDGDVLIARLSLAADAHAALPYQGDEYTVFVQSDAVSGFEEIPVLFGKVGTDGDLVLILPKPTEEVYTFIVVNNSYQATAALQSGPQRRDNLGVDPETSVVSALSQFQEDRSSAESDNEDFSESANDAESTHDMAGFRVTTNPALDEDAYQPIRINQDLFDEQSGQFDFEQFFNTVYVNAATTQLTEEYNVLETRARQYRTVIDNLQVRLSSNPNDETAATQLRENQSTLKSIEDMQQDIASEMVTYETLSYDPSIFQNFQEKAIVINN